MTLDQILIDAYQSGNIYHGWITAAIGAAGSIIGGLFGSKKKTEESESTSTSTVNYQAMVDSAMAAGFNPLTAIRNGGTGGFVTTHTKGKNISAGGGASIGAGIADAAAQIAPLFGSIGVKNDPIKLKNKTTGAISPLVSQQLRGSTRQAGSVVVAPRQTTRSSPVTSRLAGNGVYGPPTPRDWTKANGGMDLYVPYFDRSRYKVIWGPNPDIPDLDQMATPPAMAIPNSIADGVRPMSKWTWVNPLKPMAYPRKGERLQSGGW